MVMEQAHKLIEQAARASRSHAGEAAFSFDRESDTLFVHFYGAARSSISVPVDDPEDAWYLLWEPETAEVVGLQIEGFLTHFIFRHPEFGDALAVARLRGISREEALAVAQRAREQNPPVAAVTHFLERLIA